MKNLNDISTKPPKGFSKNEAKDELKELRKRLLELQTVMYAQGKYSLLVVLQGMDASGKDGLINHAFAKIPAYGISVSSFKVPTKEELAHDFLWRVHKETPRKGEIKIFNRSHYEDVLVTRMLGNVSDELAKERFRIINNFEEIIAQNNTIVVKFYLHTSKEEQEKRLKERMENPEKHWKHSDGDWQMREHWDLFRTYYQDVIDNCSVPFEWNIIPADENKYKELQVLKKLIAILESLDLKYPELKTEMLGE